MTELRGSVALVTGASRGIGAAIARTLARAGGRIVVHYNRSEAPARAVAREIAEGGHAPPFLVKADLANEAERREAFRKVSGDYGEPLVLVNNAAVYERNPFTETDDAEFLRRWRGTLGLNLEAAAHLSLLCLPAMRRKRFGRIVMVSSRAAFRGETDCPDYAVSKAGMVNLARCLARAEGPNGITANSVCPGWVATEMSQADLLERGEAIRGEIPIGRVATPEDVANAVLFYASDLGSYANGTALPLNGGSFLH